MRSSVLGLWLLAATAGPAWSQGLRPPELSVQYHRAESALKGGGSVLEAKARVDRVLRELPNDVEALKLRVEVLLAMERPQEAFADAQHAARLAPADVEALLLLCEAARMAGERTAALRALDAAAEHVTEDMGLHVRLSWNAVELQQLDKAEAFARIALALEPDESAAYLQLARVFLLQQNENGAVETLSRGLRSSALRMDMVQSDPLLSSLGHHPALVPGR